MSSIGLSSSSGETSACWSGSRRLQHWGHSMAASPKQLTPLDSLKGFPLQIRPVIECVAACENLPIDIHWAELKKCLAPRLLDLPGRFRNRRVENLVSAQALPTAAKLNLVRKVRRVWRLTYY